jgi:hypothetical protein
MQAGGGREPMGWVTLRERERGVTPLYIRGKGAPTWGRGSHHPLPGCLPYGVTLSWLPLGSMGPLGHGRPLHGPQRGPGIQPQGWRPWSNEGHLHGPHRGPCGHPRRVGHCPTLLGLWHFIRRSLTLYFSHIFFWDDSVKFPKLFC